MSALFGNDDGISPAHQPAHAHLTSRKYICFLVQNKAVSRSLESQSRLQRGCLGKRDGENRVGHVGQ